MSTFSVFVSGYDVLLDFLHLNKCILEKSKKFNLFTTEPIKFGRSQQKLRTSVDLS